MSARKETKDQLAAALKDVQKAPHKEELWDKLEDLAATQQRPEEVAELYRKLIRESKKIELVPILGQRAVRFHEEWFGAQAEDLLEILTRVLEVDPGSEWALRRLSVLYTVKERWSDLLGLYDQSLAAIDEVGRRRELLAEAAHIAKDFVGDIDRTIGYLQEQQRLAPADGHLSAQLERLLERQGRWQELAALWKARLEFLPEEEERALRERIATCRLDKLDDPAGALEELRPLLSDGHDDTAACELLERILRLEGASVPVRRQTLELLKARYDATGRANKIVPVLRVALEFPGTSIDEKAALHREVGERLAVEGDRAGAMEQFVILMALLPAARDVQERLRHLSEMEGNFRPYVRGLIGAAEATADAARRVDLLLEAARIHESSLDDPQGAVGFFRRAHAEPSVEAGVRLEAIRKLAELLGRFPDAVERPGERLDVLEKLAEQLAGSAPQSAERRAVLGQVARLADAGSDLDRAVAAWTRRLEIDPGDRTAIDGLVDLLDRARRFEPLAGALRKRIAVSASAAQRRADMVRIAQLQAGELGQREAAIETWTEVQKSFGEDTETVAALADLFSVEGRWNELAELLDRSGLRDSGRLADLFCRLADAHREKLGDPNRAVDFYARALAADPAHAGALAGARALLDVDACRAATAEVLAGAYEKTGSFKLVLELLEARLQAAPDDGTRVQRLLEAARLAEQRGEDPKAALGHVARALPMSAEDGVIERELLRLGDRAADWPPVVEALRAAASALPQDSRRAVHLRFQEGSVRERELKDPAGALEAYRAALEREPGRLEVREAVVRTAALTGRWDLAAQAAFGGAVAREALERTLLPVLESMATNAGALASLAEAAMAVAASGTIQHNAPLARDLEARVGRWFEAAEGETGKDRAEAALVRAAAHARRVRETSVAATETGDAFATSEVVVLKHLAALQRRSPGRPLCDTLLQIAELAPTDLDPLRETAALALGPMAAEPLAGTILSRLLDQASRLLRTGQVATGAHTAEAAAAWAIEELVRMQVAKPDRSAWMRAVDLLLDGTRLPLSADVVRPFRRHAADLALEKLRDRRLTIFILRQTLDEEVQDQEALGRLAALYAEEKRLPELLALRQEELQRTSQIERRLALRLEMERIAASLEERSGRIDVLKANLEEQPGHAATIETLASVLEAKFRHGELTDILADQARRLEEREDPTTAARMWAWAAQLAERPLGDRDRAISCHERVAELDPRPETFEALGRLYFEKDEPLVAAVWLERWQASTQGEARTRAALRLSKAYLRADKRQRAVACLERALSDQPDANEVRMQLVELYRAAEAWEPLVRALNDGCNHLSDPETILAWAKEAAELSESRLGSPRHALGALEKAAAMTPADRALRSAYAEALLAAGELDRARELLQALLKESGRRRSRERAAVHHRLARVASEQKNVKEALQHLEQAAEMDMDNAAVLQTLAEVAEGAADLDRAERAYRALILLVRRSAPGATLSATEALLRLRKIAIERGQAEKGQDLLDSAVAEAASNPEEAQRLGRALREQGAGDVLKAVLDKRLAATSDAAHQAEILSELAELAEAEGRREDALSAILSAVEKAPDALVYHATARRITKEAGASARYLEALQTQIDHKRRRGDAPIACELMLTAAEIAEQDLGDLDRAAELYARAGQVGVEAGEAVVRAAFALVRLAKERGNQAEKAKAVRALGRMTKENVPHEVRVEALFRLAEIQMDADETRDKALSALSQALEHSSDIDRAFAIVREAKVPEAELAKVLPLYERVARASGDDRMLLDFLERRASLPVATPEEAKEGVELAIALNEAARAETLLQRSVELARAQGEDGNKILEWALLELAQVRRTSGDIAGAVACLEEARGVADPVRILRLYQDIAHRALQGRGDPAVAARVYERLWEREPAERRYWEPLLKLYAQLKDREGLERVARAAAEKLFDPSERNLVRMARARFLASLDKQDPAVVEVLRDVLMEEPTHADAIALLADVYQATGNEEGLTELLLREIEAARERKDVPAVVSLSLRLGERLLQTQPGEARDIYRNALAVAPDSPELLRALANLLSPEEDARERAVLLERLLERADSAEEAGQLALEVGALWGSLGEEERVRKALELGVARGPGGGPVFERLCDFYRERRAWNRLAGLLIDEVERRPNEADKAALLKEAADLQKTNLGRPREAAEMLRRARALAPWDGQLLGDLVATLDELGERALAAEEVSQALEAVEPGPNRAALLRLRAELRERNGEPEAAVTDLEEAFKADPAEVGPSLREALHRWRARAAETGDAAAERHAVMRLAQLLTDSGEAEQARAVLADWSWRHGEDTEALRLLLARDQAAERWEAVVEGCVRLIEVETGEAQIAAAESLVAACERLGQPAAAVPGLEAVLEQQPEHPWLFERLMALYEQAGERRKQAVLMLWAAERTPDLEQRYVSLRQAGEIFLRERDMAGATAAFHQALALRPGDRELSLLVAEVCIGDGRLEEAEQILENLMKNTAKDLSSAELSTLQHKMAQLAEARGDHDARLEWLKRAFDTNRKNGTVAVELADVAEAVSDFDLAVKALRAVTLLPSPGPMSTAMAFYRQARIAQRNGDRPRAVIFAKRALQEDPRLMEAAEFLKQIGERRA
jgi:tetratricopeptide (TPR) repeat protein